MGTSFDLNKKPSNEDAWIWNETRKLWEPTPKSTHIATASTDVAPNDDTTPKKLTIQRLASDPTNAAFIKFSNSPGTPANDFYLVLEEA